MIISNYITKIVLQSLIRILILMFALHIVIWTFGEMRDIGKGYYHFIEMIQFVLLQAPYQLCELFPFVGLLGGLLGLGSLASNNELVAIRASGISVGRICWIVLRLAGALSIAILAIQEFVAPQSVHMAEEKKIAAISKNSAVRAQGGIWFRKGNDYIYVNNLDKNNQLNVVYRYSFDNSLKITNASFAQTGIIDNGKWRLRKVSETNFLENSIQSKQKDEETWDYDLPLSLLQLSFVYPEELSMRQLFNYMKEQSSQDVLSNNYEMLFMQRALQPFGTLVMMLLSIPMILGPLRTTTVGFRLLVGISIGFAFYLLNRLLGPASIVYHFPPLLGVLTSQLIFFTAGLWLIRRYR